MKNNHSEQKDPKLAPDNDKLLIFKLYGNFAHFNQPISNRFRNTYSIIPKTQLLGLVGSIAGLNGYKNNKLFPEYYQLIGNMKLFIKFCNKSEKKFTVKYNSFNSFLSNRVDAGPPNVIMQEQILYDPDYEIGLLLNENESLHNKIIDNIRSNRSYFPIYLGKNEFFANIKFISLNSFSINSSKKINCQSILPFDELEKGSTINLKLEMLPVDFNDKFKFIYKLMAIPISEISLTIKNPKKFINSNGKTYYVI